jgi:glycosyltransferase involved in cell wall biosynthesis
VTAAVRPLLVLPADPELMSLGGIATFVRGFVKFAPEDFEFGMIGVSSHLRSGRWTEVTFEGRPMQFLPLLRADTARRSRVPLALRYVLAGLRHRPDLRDWIPSLHRTGTHPLLRGHAGPAWRVVHGTREGATAAGSESRWRRAPSLLDRVEAREFALMDRIYVVNRAAVDRYRIRFPQLAGRFRFLPNWVDNSLFRAQAAETRHEWRRAAEGRYRLPAGTDLLLYAGRLEGVKNPLLLADAFGVLAKRRPTVRLLIAGDGAMRRSVERRLAERGVGDAARFLGVVPRTELARLMAVADVLLVTSLFETGPTAGYEALASGVPVVMTRVGEVADLVERHGAGRVIARGSADELAAGVEDVLAGPRQDLRQRALAASEPFAAQRILAEVYEYQRELAARGAAL